MFIFYLFDLLSHILKVKYFTGSSIILEKFSWCIINTTHSNQSLGRTPHAVEPSLLQQRVRDSPVTISECFTVLPSWRQATAHCQTWLRMTISVDCHWWQDTWRCWVAGVEDLNSIKSIKASSVKVVSTTDQDSFAIWRVEFISSVTTSSCSCTLRLAATTWIVVKDSVASLSTGQSCLVIWCRIHHFKNHLPEHIQSHPVLSASLIQWEDTEYHWESNSSPWCSV